MDILNNYWDVQTAIFTVIFLAVVFVSARKKTDKSAMSKETSNELRGLAILGILFAHLTYGKFFDTEFLFPLGIWGGIAVNLFFFLSGYGLAASAIYHPRSLGEFYRKRLVKIYLPLWIFLFVILAADFLLLGRSYPWMEILRSFLGYFPEANLFTSINSPLWFLTPLLFYYLVFPLIFKSKHPRVSVAAVFAVSLLALWSGWPVSEQILKYYQTHWLAFPLGVLLAVLIVSPRAVCTVCLRNSRCRTYRLFFSALAGDQQGRAKPLAAVIGKFKALSAPWRFIALACLAGLAWQTAYHSGVGRGIGIEHAYAFLTMACLALFFAFKKTKFYFLELVGIYSFEIYLWHWPLISRYDIFYGFFPPWLATVLYLPLLLLIAYLFNRLVKLIVNRILPMKLTPLPSGRGIRATALDSVSAPPTA